jgi:hypothetical protein
MCYLCWYFLNPAQEAPSGKGSFRSLARRFWYRQAVGIYPSTHHTLETIENIISDPSFRAQHFHSVRPSDVFQESLGKVFRLDS